MKKLLTLSIACALVSASAFVSAGPIKAKIEAAMASDIRTDAEIKRDRNRRPVQTLEFFGVEDDMRVVELVPGGGWYTKLLAPALNENGEYFAAIGTSRIERNLADQPGFEKMRIVGKEVSTYREEGERFSSIKATDLGVSDADVVLTFRNYHNFSEQGRKKMNELAFKALKPGGIYGVVDHTARHMEAPNNSNRRRVDPVLAIKEIQEAGFVMVDYSTLHYREDDELEYEVGVKSVAGNTDRWTIKFMKPE
ncbi:class I SAM-dependent methyltransferase [Glaciecola sp. MH2013]|uniref:class I SAM-dependent methyltransferase n=1 Tax=Glaciecola sp. MH2013 TaxID=2785524 RepID=UPI00189F314F|nr:class I SAM-dependent methyltransferase [Glaciecola sp. MH2013]MBF7074481.1 class I SAM-dependent methyltransferase [Glaciecola sp. MH2013]